MQGGSRLVIHTERKPCAWGKVLPVDEFTSTDRELWSLFSQLGCDSRFTVNNQ